MIFGVDILPINVFTDINAQYLCIDYLKPKLEGLGYVVNGYSLIDLYDVLPEKPASINLYSISIAINNLIYSRYGMNTILPCNIPSVFM